MALFFEHQNRFAAATYPIWGKLPAVRDGKVYLWNENLSWFRDPIAVKGQINSLADWILKSAKSTGKS